MVLSITGGRHRNAILDRFTTLDEVTDAVRKAGLEACGLIFGKARDKLLDFHPHLP